MIVLPAVAQTEGNATDREIIKSMALKWQDTWNQHDMKALTTSLIAEDVNFITSGGTWQKNRKEFEEYHIDLHKIKHKESVLTMKNTTVKFIKPDVAVAHVEWSIKGDKNLDETPRQPRQGIMTWTLEKRKGKWLIIASQNTNLRAPAPVK